ncbi:hypothetical protein SETIT_1G147200v2 [Setaria italica]|uniref:Uncharacterized protein n=1 Tax=Setaria italica TaxID=4555 RepID=A0A368PKE7_SETIT|nr:hypothetical protein SETIT_1G147200v2 [Setaria italica]
MAIIPSTQISLQQAPAGPSLPPPLPATLLLLSPLPSLCPALLSRGDPSPAATTAAAPSLFPRADGHEIESAAPLLCFPSSRRCPSSTSLKPAVPLLRLPLNPAAPVLRLPLEPAAPLLCLPLQLAAPLLRPPPQVDGSPTPPPTRAGGACPPPGRSVAWPCGVHCPMQRRCRLAVQGPKPVVGAPGRRQWPRTTAPPPPLTPSSSVQIEVPRQGFKHAPLAETWHWRASFWSVAHLEVIEILF